MNLFRNFAQLVKFLFKICLSTYLVSVSCDRGVFLVQYKFLLPYFFHLHPGTNHLQLFFFWDTMSLCASRHIVSVYVWRTSSQASLAALVFVDSRNIGWLEPASGVNGEPAVAALVWRNPVRRHWQLLNWRLGSRMLKSTFGLFIWWVWTPDVNCTTFGTSSTSGAALRNEATWGEIVVLETKYFFQALLNAFFPSLEETAVVFVRLPCCRRFMVLERIGRLVELQRLS